MLDVNYILSCCKHIMFVKIIHMCQEYLTVLLFKVCIFGNSHHFQPKTPNQTPVEVTRY